MYLVKDLNTLPGGAQRPTGPLTKPPRECAVLPHRTTDPEGFIETRNSLPGMRDTIVVSVAGVREMARIIGMVDKTEVESLVNEFEVRFAALQAEYQDLRNRVAKTEELERARALVALADEGE